MTRAEKVKRAQYLRDCGLLLREVADEMDVSTTTVLRWLNPERAEHDRAASRAWKAANRARKHEYDRAYYLNPANYAKCSRCDGPMSRTHGQCVDGEEPLCAVCRSEIRHERALQIEDWWREGLLFSEICKRLGWSKGHLSQEMDRLRATGYDLPYRYDRRRAHRYPELFRAA